jgi:energy-coupling factor transporter ATP-binding protein EcfA2
MALLDDILKWTETNLPLWQRDAARRLFQKEDGLSSDDYAELYALLKAAHGLPNPLNLMPAPLAATHLPAVLQAGAPVVLKTLRDLKHVNRIAPGQKLNFAPIGMTVIYGGNGTGKSGYARVMKRACRARDQAEKVHSDANDLSAQIRIPEATFDIEISGTPKQVKWTAGTVSPDELSTIAVFDCHCARAYLTAEQDVAYLPYGLDVVENLANKVLPELSRRLDHEISGINVDRQPFDHLLGETEVGRLISTLNEKTDPAKIKALGTLSELETKRVAELDQALAEPDPRAKAKELRLSAGRLKALVGRVESALAWVTDDAIKKLNNLDDSVVAANKAEKVAAERLRSGENLLPGTGEPVWKALFDAARKFSTEVAYPGIEFPRTGEGAVCPLCQDPLRDAGERLERFEQYIKDDVAKAASQQRQVVEAEKTKIERTNVAVGLDESLTGELALLDDAVAPTARAFQATLDARRTWMLEALNSHVWDNVPVLSENPRQRLRNLAARHLKSARIFDRAADEAKSKALKAECARLRARQNLATCVDAVLALIDRMKMKRLLESCEQDLKTRPISEKSKVFARKAVTPALKKALEIEFTVLGIGYIKTKVKDRPDRGKMWYRLLLDLPSTHKLEEILSEGEQRAIALGSFLAELKLANHAGGIVFDDPVSSLDHWWRQNVAKRLVEEAARRQVIVLTHDTSFLGQLRDEIELKNTPHSIQFLEWKDNNPGYVSDGLPWEHQGYKERIDALEKAQRAFVKMPWPAYPGQAESSKMRHQYGQLRATIERVIQDVVFNGVVKRYRDWIRVDSLAEVVGFEASEHDEIERLHKRCCDVVDAHDPSSAKNAPVPSAQDFGRDIEALRNVISAIKARRKNTKTAASGASRS